MHLNCELLFRHYALPVVEGARVLEVGPNTVPSILERASCSASWQTADIAHTAWDGSPIDYKMTDEYSLPLADSSVDVVVSANVIEHVRQPWRWMVELARVTRPGGAVVTINPVSWPFHEAPIDCWRIYPEGMRALSAEAGLAVEVSVCEALEPRRSRRVHPGTGLARSAYAPTWKSKVATLAGWPMPVSYDTLTIARKEAPSDPPPHEARSRP